MTLTDAPFKVKRMAPESSVTGERIREVRLQLGDTQVDFARRLNLAHPASVSRWERGEQTPELHRLRQIALLGGVTLDFFFNENGKDAA